MFEPGSGLLLDGALGFMDSDFDSWVGPSGRLSNGAGD